MPNVISKIVLGFSILAVVLTLAVTLVWVGIVRRGDGIYAMGFMAFVAPVLGGGSLLFGVIPAGVLHARWRLGGNLLSLWLAGAAILVLLIEVVVLFFVPLHGC